MRSLTWQDFPKTLLSRAVYCCDFTFGMGASDISRVRNQTSTLAAEQLELLAGYVSWKTVSASVMCTPTRKRLSCVPPIRIATQGWKPCSVPLLAHSRWPGLSSISCAQGVDLLLQGNVLLSAHVSQRFKLRTSTGHNSTDNVVILLCHSSLQDLTL